MNDLFKKFLEQYNGQSNVGNTPENKGQCVGLSEVWNDDFLHFQHEWGNACDLLANADTSLFDVVLNTPTGVPQVGDIIVWSKEFNGTVGHTGVATGTGDTNTFEVFEQNDPLGSNCHLKTYNYNCVAGWLHPKGEKVFVTTTQQVTLDGDKFKELVTKSTEDDAFHAAGFTSVDDTIKQLKDLRDENTGLKTQISQSESARADLAGELQKKSNEDATAIDEGLKAQKERDSIQADFNSLCDALQCPKTVKDALTAIDSLKTASQDISNHAQKVIPALADAAFLKKKVPPQPSFLEKLVSLPTIPFQKAQDLYELLMDYGKRAYDRLAGR